MQTFSLRGFLLLGLLAFGADPVHHLGLRSVEIVRRVFHGGSDEAVHVQAGCELGRILAAAACRLGQQLRDEGLAERRVAIELNGEISPRSQHASQALQEGDRVEIVHALGGG